jgi:hypothetical protein
MSKALPKILMWIAWGVLALYAILIAKFLSTDPSRLNTFSTSFGVFPIAMILIPVLICGGTLFWVSRIRNRWLALFPYLIALVFASQAEMYGIFIFQEYLVVFQILSTLLFIVSCPLFVKAPKDLGSISLRT